MTHIDLNLLDTPAVVIRYDVAKRNIQTMIDGLTAHNIAHRPHIKAHKSTLLAKLQLDCGAKGVTCAKLSEAEAMAAAGITDILIANQIIGPVKCRRLMELCKSANILTLVDSMEGALGLDAAAREAGITCKALIEVDIGSKRCGITPDQAVPFMKQLSTLKHLEIIGIMSYGGLGYEVTPGEGTRQEAARESSVMRAICSDLREAGFEMSVISAGSSYTSRHPEELAGITESRAGNYIFNDATTLGAGVCTPDECAMRVIATIISIPEKGRCIIDAGTKTLSSDKTRWREGYGYVEEYPEMVIYALNEEHGYIRYADTDRLRIGQKISIIPNHACVINNLAEEVFGVRDDGVMFLIPVEARGKNR